MNEQIRLIAIKAGIDIRGHLTESGPIVDEKPSISDLEKFAELLIEEVRSICCENMGYSDTKHVYSRLEQDFGVKE
jgi:hypothetical protein